MAYPVDAIVGPIDILKLPAAGSDGQYIKTVDGKPTWVMETPQGIVTETGANVANTIGADTSASIPEKVTKFVLEATTSVKGKVQLATAAELEAGTDAAKALTPAVVRPATIKRSKMPDGATAVYSQDAWATTDGWSMYNTGALTADAVNGVLRYTADSSDISKHILKNIGANVFNKYYVVCYRTNKTNLTLKLCGFSTPQYAQVPGSTDWAIAICKTAVDMSYGGNTQFIGFGFDSGHQAGDWFEIDWVWVGSSLYLNGTLAEYGTTIINVIANTSAIGGFATGTITSNGTNVSANDTVTVHGKVYTFVSGTPSAEGQVLIGATAQESLANLALAVNRTDPSTNDGVKYKIAAAHPLVTASANSLILTITAMSADELGNQIILMKNAATLTLSGSTLTGGYSVTAKKLATLAAPIIAGNGTRPAAALIDITDTSKIGYEDAVDVASGGTVTLPSGGAWLWFVYGYGATISGAKRGISAGGTVLTVSGANATVWYRRYA